MAVNYRALCYQFRYVFVVSGLFAAIFCAHIALYHFIHPVDYVVSCDVSTSLKTEQAVYDYLSNYTWKNCHTCVQDLQDTFASLSSVEILLHPCSIAYIDIQTKEPRFVVNDKYVLTYDNTLHEKSYFSDLISQRAAIYIHDLGHKIDPLVLYALNQHEYQLYEQFTFKWMDADHVYFHDKKDPLWHLLCSFETCVTDEFISQYSSIITQKKVVKEHVVDVRFADQIVVYQGTGECYG